jgi:hypothetical protein
VPCGSLNGNQWRICGKSCNYVSIHILQKTCQAEEFQRFADSIKKQSVKALIFEIFSHHYPRVIRVSRRVKIGELLALPT